MTLTEERIRHYLNQLPEPYRSQALSQVDPKWFKSVKTEQITSRSKAVYAFADWEKTNEKADYWYEFYNLLPLKDPKTPDSIQFEINELQSRIDTLKEQLKQLNNESK